MPTREAQAQWSGTLKDGAGSMLLEHSLLRGEYSFGARFNGHDGTSPEELLAAAQAQCFAMALAGELGRSGYSPQSIEASVSAHLQRQGPRFAVVQLELRCRVRAPNLPADALLGHARAALQSSPIANCFRQAPRLVEATLAPEEADEA